MDYTKEMKKGLLMTLENFLADSWDDYLLAHPGATMANTPTGEFLEWMKVDMDSYKERNL